MSDLISFNPVRALDANGNPVAGARAFFYTSGTTTPVTVFSDAAEQTPHPSPLLADAEGVFPPVFRSGQPIKVDVQTPGGESLNGFPLDPVLTVPASGAAASQVSFEPTEEIPGTNVQDAIDRVQENLVDKVSEHAEEQGGIHGIPEGERARHTGDNIAETPIGGYVTVQTDLTGAEEPDPASHIKLEAGLTGAGDYNEGKLNNESVSGSAPLVEATAEIVDAESPLNGQTVHLLETERRFLRAGESGTVENDQMQRITGDYNQNMVGPRSTTVGDPPTFNGAFSSSVWSVNTRDYADGTNTRPETDMFFNSANSPGARASGTTDGETRAKNIGVSVYMRIK